MLLPWRSRSKAESVCDPAFVWCEHTNGPRAVPRVAAVPGGWVALGSYLPWSRQTELVDRHRKRYRVVMPGDWPEKRHADLAKTG